MFRRFRHIASSAPAAAFATATAAAAAIALRSGCTPFAFGADLAIGLSALERVHRGLSVGSCQVPLLR